MKSKAKLTIILLGVIIAALLMITSIHDYPGLHAQEMGNNKAIPLMENGLTQLVTIAKY